MLVTKGARDDNDKGGHKKHKVGVYKEGVSSTKFSSLHSPLPRESYDDELELNVAVVLHDQAHFAG